MDTTSTPSADAPPAADRGLRGLRLLMLLAAAVVAVYHGVLRPVPGPGETRQIEEQVNKIRLWQGRFVPEVEAPLLGGGTFRLSEHIGKHVVLLNFFASWCAPCRAEMPELERYAAAHAADGLVLVGIDVGETESTVRAFIDELKISFPVILDGESSINNDFLVDSFPTSVLIGRDGRVALYETGAIGNADVALGPALAAALAAPTTTVEQWRTALAAQPPIPGHTDAATKALSGRAREIAKAMPCPCGCTDNVLHCKCGTSTKVKEKLATLPLEGRTDADVMQELDREFCVGVADAARK